MSASARRRHCARSEERFRTLVQFSFDVYWETDPQHRFTRQEFAETLPEPPVSEIGRTRWEVPYLEPDAEGWRKHREILDARLPFRDFELARPTADGGKRYISVSGLPIFDETGHFMGYRRVGRHITERKRAEQALIESEARFRTFVDHATDTFMLHSEDGRVLDVNRNACEKVSATAGANWSGQPRRCSIWRWMKRPGVSTASASRLAASLRSRGAIAERTALSFPLKSACGNSAKAAGYGSFV